MRWGVIGQMTAFFGQPGPMFDQLVQEAKEWQPLLAGTLLLLASIILAAGLVKSAKIRAAAAARNRDMDDLRTPVASISVDADAFDNLRRNLELLRSLLRSALSSLSSVDTDHEAARRLCTRIVAFQGGHFALPIDADKPMRGMYATLLKQFEMLEAVLRKEWSPSETSATLIQLNASARGLYAILEQNDSNKSDTLNRQNKY